MSSGSNLAAKVLAIVMARPDRRRSQGLSSGSEDHSAPRGRKESSSEDADSGSEELEKEVC